MRAPMQRLDPSFLLLRLKHSTTAQDDLSETLASSFIRQPPPDEADLHGKDIDEFVKQFKELRKTYHKRTMWGDQWASGKVSWRED
jgi:ESCRT-I complex subunit VPS37